MKALITGITGQDGSYLARLLIHKGYEVIGVLDSSRTSNLWNLDYLDVLASVKLVSARLSEYVEIQRLLLEFRPDEVYALAAQSSVGASFGEPMLTMSANTNVVVNWLESIRTLAPKTKFYQASSSEMYGNTYLSCITKDTLFNPVSPYAVSKVAAHYLVRSYRDAYGIYAVSGILFNHESALRKKGFFSRKLMDGVLALADGEIDSLSFGNLSVKRDFGYSPDYVVPMWKMLQLDSPEDFLICTGESSSLHEIVLHVFACMGVSVDALQVDPALYRPVDIADIYGSPDYAAQKLGWRSSFNAKTAMEKILEERLRMKSSSQMMPF